MRRRPPPGPPAQPRTGTRTAALLLLGRRDYTAKELGDKLEARGHDAEDIARVLRELASEGLQSDERLAAAYIRTATRARGRGRLRIARELEQRGVDRQIVRRLIADLAPEDESAAIATILLRKHWPASPTLAERRRMFQHLLRRGFSADAIARALKHRDDE